MQAVLQLAASSSQQLLGAHQHETGSLSVKDVNAMIKWNIVVSMALDLVVRMASNDAVQYIYEADDPEQVELQEETGMLFLGHRPDPMAEGGTVPMLARFFASACPGINVILWIPRKAGRRCCCSIRICSYRARAASSHCLCNREYHLEHMGGHAAL